LNIDSSVRKAVANRVVVFWHFVYQYVVKALFCGFFLIHLSITFQVFKVYELDDVYFSTDLRITKLNQEIMKKVNNLEVDPAC
jgi:hypothetical protein